MGGENVRFRVPAKPLRFEHWGAHEDFALWNLALSLAAISRVGTTNLEHTRHKIYTSSGHHCGVIPYSSVWWWIATQAKDEQYKGKNSLLMGGAPVLGELVVALVSLDPTDPRPSFSRISRINLTNSQHKGHKI